VREYDLFLPLFHNDGTPIETKRFKALQKYLLDRFDGFTFFPQANEGHWRMGNVVYRDQIVIYRILTAGGSSARKSLARLKEKLKKDFKQEEILIIERNVRTL